MLFNFFYVNPSNTSVTEFSCLEAIVNIQMMCDLIRDVHITAFVLN